MPGEPQYSTFSLCAIDPATNQSGAAVTTRVPFVGRAVPHVRAGVGAVCTQASTMVEFGPRGLDLIEKGVEPQEILKQLLGPDENRESRQVGVIDMRAAPRRTPASATVRGPEANRASTTPCRPTSWSAPKSSRPWRRVSNPPPAPACRSPSG